MTIRRIRLVTVAAVLVLSAVLTAQQNGKDLYQQGLARETAGDLKSAIQIFERIVRDYSADRPLAARALVQLGRWFDSLGENQARKYYERVIREFADQKDAAAEARAHLDALVKAVAPVASPARRLIVDHKLRDPYTRPTHDGRHLLRYNSEQRAFELVEIGTGEVRRLTADGPNPAQAVVGASELSRDGRRLAATIRLRAPATGVELRVFDVGGRGTGGVLATWDTNAVSSAQPFAWAPRNDRLWLFVRRDQSAQIATVDLGGRLEVLKTLTWRDDMQAPSLSHDGRFLAYHNAPDPQIPPDLYIIATDGSREQRVEHPANDSKPMFLPDGSGVVFESDRRGARDLWFLAVVDGRPGGQPRLVWRDVGSFGPERFADTGSLFFYSSTDDWGTYTVPLDLEAAVGSIGETTRLATVNNERNSGPAFSPDGRYLAHFRANGTRIVVRALATGLERETPFGARLGNGRADWCPGGDALIAVGYVGGIGEVAYRVNVKDSSVQRLPIAPSPYDRALCVGDGEEIIYVPRRAAWPTPPSIVRRSLASGREVTLFTGAINIDSVARSMDGKRLAFITSINPEPPYGYRVVTLSADGGDISTVMMSARAQVLSKLVWMPSGDRLLVVHWESSTKYLLWEVPLTGAAPRKLGYLPVPDFDGGYGVGSLSVHPDGKLLAFDFHEGFLQQTWAIENLFQFIKAGSK